MMNMESINTIKKKQQYKILDHLEKEKGILGLKNPKKNLLHNTKPLCKSINKKRAMTKQNVIALFLNFPLEYSSYEPLFFNL